MNNRKCFLVNIKSYLEADGRLLVIEGNSTQIPFEIKRIFWVRDVKEGEQRGQHATKHTKLILIAISGSCDVVINDGTTESIYHLNDPSKGLYIDKMLWRTMKNFSKDCILEAICDRIFDPTDETFDNFDEYLQELGKKTK